jgi:signal transduction histidine kinase
VQIQAVDGLRVHVSDDGRGFPSAEAVTSDGGLGNVRQRVEDLGGHLNVGSDSRGTHIAIVLPTLRDTVSGS